MSGAPLVPVGRVGRRHGVDGAFVVEGASTDPKRFQAGATLYADGEPVTITLTRRVGGNRRAIALDRPVERGTLLAVRADELPQPEPGHFYVFQLVGLDVVEQGGRALGTVQDVLEGVANDNLVLDGGALVPMVEDVVLEVDIGGGRVVIAPGFAD